MNKTQDFIFIFMFSLLFITGIGSSPTMAYVYHLDEFEVSGTISGPVSDDFNDGVLNTALWEVYDPIISESGGFVSFSSPGTAYTNHFGQFVINGEMSYLDSRFSMADGQGNYTATSTWDGIIPSLDEFYIMNHDTGVMDENIMIGVSQWGLNASAIFGTMPGPMIFFGRVTDMSAGDFLIQGVPVSSGDISGSIILQMTFDDVTDQFSASYSLDGGTTFIAPFSSVTPASGVFVGGDWTLGVESWDVQAVPSPSSLIVMLSGIIALFFRFKLFKIQI